MRGLAVCADSRGSEGGHFAVFGNLEFGCADFLASFLQGCFVVIGVNFLDGDGIGAAGHGAGSGIVFAVELHSEAMGNGATVGVFRPSWCIWCRRRPFGTGMGSDLDLAIWSFQVPRSGLLCASSEVLAKAAKTASVTNFKMRFISFAH